MGKKRWNANIVTFLATAIVTFLATAGLMILGFVLEGCSDRQSVAILNRGNAHVWKESIPRGYELEGEPSFTIDGTNCVIVFRFVRKGK